MHPTYSKPTGALWPVTRLVSSGLHLRSALEETEVNLVGNRWIELYIC